MIKLLFTQNDIDDVNFKDAKGCSLLFHAAQNRYDAAVNLLVMQNVIDVNLTDQNGLFPLLYAAKNGHESIVRLLWHRMTSMWI